MKKSIYFGSNGITSTSANTLANWAKEYVKNVPSFQLYNETLSLINGEEKLIKIGINKLDFSFLNKKAKAYSLIAWLREAIKAKQELQNEINNVTFEQFCSIQNIEIPESPIQEHILTEEEYWDSRSTKERNRYYELETICSVIGKFIHPDGEFSSARDELKDIINNPIKVDKDGVNTLIYTRTPSINIIDVDKEFFSLQNKHREYQSQLNAMKYECEKACVESETNSISKYSKELEDYNEKCSQIRAELNKYKREKMTETMNLKIIIPDSLQDIYKEISNLGKNTL